MIEFICDISQLQKELEHKLKEALELNDVIARLEKETHLLKQTNLDNDLKREKIVESLKIGIEELEETKVYVKKLETERNTLSVELSLIKLENEELQDYKKTNFDKISELEKTLCEKETTISDLNKLVDQQTLLENKLLEYKDKFQTQHQEFERVLSERDRLDKASSTAQEKAKQLEFTVRDKDLGLKELEDKLAVYKNLFEDEKKKTSNFHKNLKEKEFEFNKEINLLSILLEENNKKLEKNSFETCNLDKELNRELKEKEKLNQDLIKFESENALLNIEKAKLHDKLAEAAKKEKGCLEKIELLNRDYFDVKQKYDIACFDIEDAKKNYIQYEKEIEIFKSEKNQFLCMYEKEKKDVQIKESVIKALENEIHQKSKQLSNLSKISNLSFVNLKASFKNILNSFDCYNVKVSAVKNKMLFLDEVEDTKEDDYEALDNKHALNVNNKRENYENKNNFDSNNFNFRKYVGKDRDKGKDNMNTNFDRKRNERNFNLNDILYNNKNPCKNFVDNCNKNKSQLNTHVKNIIYSIESFGEWIDIIKEEISVIFLLNYLSKLPSA